MEAMRANEINRRYALAGAVAGVVWHAAEPALQRVFGHPYSDPELVTAFLTRGRWQPPLNYLTQVVGGGAFGWGLARLGGRTTPQAVLAAAAEGGVLVASFGRLDRVHPDVRDGTWPPLAGNPRAAAVALSGRVLFALLLGRLAGRSRT